MQKGREHTHTVLLSSRSQRPSVASTRNLGVGILLDDGFEEDEGEMSRVLTTGSAVTYGGVWLHNQSAFQTTNLNR